MDYTSKADELAATRALTRSGVARLARRAAGLSLNDIAEPVGVSKSTVWRWECNERSPRGDAALAYGRLIRRLIEGGLD